MQFNDKSHPAACSSIVLQKSKTANSDLDKFLRLEKEKKNAT